MPESEQGAPHAALVAEIDAIGQQADPAQDPRTPEVVAVRRIARSALVRNPNNPRSTKREKADPDLLASIKEHGFDPLIITRTDDPAKFMVLDGHRRLDVADHLKVETVPYSFDPALADDPVAHHLIAVITSRHKKPLTALETATALFNAAEAGASKSRLTKAYGRKNGGVEQALKVGKLPQATRSAAAACTYEWDITELAALDEFAGDAEATGRLMQAAEENKFAVQVERERIERTEREQRAVIRAEHEAAGVTVLDEEPDGAVRVSRLREKETGAHLDVEQHAACPGHAAVFESYGQVRVSFYCLEPEANGHEDSWSYSSRQNTPKVQDKAAKRAVVRGNKDHTAAQTVRETWLRGLISGAGSLSKDKLDKISRFTALATLTAPDPVRKFASAMKRAELQAGLLGMGASTREDFEQAVASASPRRLMMLHFAVVAAAYEKALTKDTWRTDMPPSEYGDADRRHARVWLEFCREVGHNLAPIEAAIVADETYTPADLSGQTGTLTGAQDGADEQDRDGGDEQSEDEDAQDEDDRDNTGPTDDTGDEDEQEDQDEPRGPAGPDAEETGAA
ncbi:MAG TPA: ParB N-terminal domain-containing protein [Actinospica sp.]|nr:ParB N-terminal domain-containing protein [Actinospica sp.]